MSSSRRDSKIRNRFSRSALCQYDLPGHTRNYADILNSFVTSLHAPLPPCGTRHHKSVTWQSIFCCSDEHSSRCDRYVVGDSLICQFCRYWQHTLKQRVHATVWRNYHHTNGWFRSRRLAVVQATFWEFPSVRSLAVKFLKQCLWFSARVNRLVLPAYNRLRWKIVCMFPDAAWNGFRRIMLCDIFNNYRRTRGFGGA